MRLTNEFGVIKEERQFNNMVVNKGLAWLSKRVLGQGEKITHIAVGTGNNSAEKAQTALTTELARGQITQSKATQANVEGDSVSFDVTFNPGVATGAISEAGLYTAETGGEMISRTVFDVVNKGANDTLSFTWRLTFI